MPDANRGKGIEWEFTFDKPADNWFEIAFDDSKWRKGRSGLPAGHARSHSAYSLAFKEIWLRRDFRFDTIPAKLTLKIHHDEDAEVYLNGKLIKSFMGYRSNYTEVDVTRECLDVLQTGRNTLAIHCKQTSGGQYIDAGLVVDQSKTPVPVLARLYGKEVLVRPSSTSTTNCVRNWKGSVDQGHTEERVRHGRGRGFASQDVDPATGHAGLKGEEVGPAFPEILAAPAAHVPNEYTVGRATGKRRVLAEWIASPENPMTVRVMANRLWQHHFGRGIVRSSNNFGFIGKNRLTPSCSTGWPTNWSPAVGSSSACISSS